MTRSPMSRFVRIAFVSVFTYHPPTDGGDGRSEYMLGISRTKHFLQELRGGGPRRRHTWILGRMIWLEGADAILVVLTNIGSMQSGFSSSPVALFFNQVLMPAVIVHGSARTVMGWKHGYILPLIVRLGEGHTRRVKEGVMVGAVSRIVVGLLVLFCLGSAHQAAAQTAPNGPVTVGAMMPDFTVPVLQGGQLTLSALRGKNVLIVFPRGYSRPGSWCHVCNYQHAELMDYEAREQWRRKANLEILWVMPYSKDIVKDWVEKYIEQLGDIEAWRRPKDPANLDETAKRRMGVAKTSFPMTFEVTRDELPGPFPILVDADRAVSRGLGLFTTDWSGSQAEQNVPTVFILDTSGRVVFKYYSQNTLDRPPLTHLVRVVRRLCEP
jgi:peroxiredoxin